MLRHKLENGVATVTIANPPLNILTIEMLNEMAAHIRRSESARVLLIQSEGDAFCAGLDMAEHAPPRAAELIGAFRDVFNALMRFEGMVVAAVDGLALGGGCELACLCDVVIASERAEFGQPETPVSVLPPVASIMRSRGRGYNRALELIMSGRRVSAVDMVAAGVVNRVFPASRFAVGVAEAVDRYKRMSPVMAVHAKQAGRIGSGADVNAALHQIESLYIHSGMKKGNARAGRRTLARKRSRRWEDS